MSRDMRVADTTLVGDVADSSHVMRRSCVVDHGGAELPCLVSCVAVPMTCVAVPMPGVAVPMRVDARRVDARRVDARRVDARLVTHVVPTSFVT